MKTSLKMGAIASACLFAWNCGDDSSSNPPAEISSSSEPLVCDLSAYGTFPLWTGAYFIGVDGSVSDGTNTVGTFDFATGSILDASGATIATLDASLLPYFDGTKLILQKLPRDQGRWKPAWTNRRRRKLYTGDGQYFQLEFRRQSGFAAIFGVG